MFNAIEQTFYMTGSKWKLGERSAFASLASQDKLHITPVWDVLPAGEYDREADKRLTPTEHIRCFGKRLKDCRGRLPNFVDAVLLDDEKHKSAVKTHPLSELLGRAEQADALAFPVTAIGRSPEYQAAVANFVRHNPERPVCIRVNVEQLELLQEIPKLVRELKVDPAYGVFLLDVPHSDLSEYTEFSHLLIDAINSIPYLRSWLQVCVMLNSFPDRPKLKAGEVKFFPRDDWKVFQELYKAEQGKLFRTPIFGDYGVELPGYRPVKMAKPVAQLRYSTEEGHFIFKGASVKVAGYEGIFPVAQRLRQHSAFMGAAYSAGDQFIHTLAESGGKTGNASTWRWAGSVHHMTLVAEQIRDLFSIPRPAKVLASEGQADLFG